MKQILKILFIVLLVVVAILVLWSQLVGLGIGDMAARTISDVSVCLAAGTFLWLGGLKWLGIDSRRNRWIGLTICLVYAGNSLMEYTLPLTRMEKNLAAMLVPLVWLGLMLAAILWLDKKWKNKTGP